MEFHHSFGTSRSDVAFWSDRVVAFTAGRLCVLLDLDSGAQRLFPQLVDVTAMVRCGAMLAAATKGHPPTVSILNTLTETKKTYLTPTYMQCEAFFRLTMSSDLGLVAAQGGSPDWLLVVWSSQNREVIATLNPTVSRGVEATVHDISFNAGGPDELMAIGRGVFKMYEFRREEDIEEGGSNFKEIAFEKYESGVYHTICWPEGEYMAVGSSDGEILLFRGVDMVGEVRPGDKLPQSIKCKDVTSVLAIPQRLFCVCGGSMVLSYRCEESGRYIFTGFVMPPEGEEDCFMDLTASPSYQDLVATTQDGQIFQCPLVDLEVGYDRYFSSELGRRPSGPVVGIDIARARPLIASCSAHELILWNLETKQQELRKSFEAKIRCVAVHSTGLYAVLALGRRCTIFDVLNRGELRERTTLACRDCSRAIFSSGGHLLAVVVCNLAIEVYTFVSCLLLSRFEGHSGPITSLDWTARDTALLSCDTRGVICGWDLASFRKKWEVTATRSYSSLATNPVDGNKFIVVGLDDIVRCYEKLNPQSPGESFSSHGKSSRSLDKFPKLMWISENSKLATCCIYSLDGNELYVGCSDGRLDFSRFSMPDEIVRIHAHEGSVSGLKLSAEGDFLITSGNDGCVFLWKKGRKTNDVEKILSGLILADVSHLAEQKVLIERLRSSLRLTEVSTCERETSLGRQERCLSAVSLDYERRIDALNERLAHIVEDTQVLLYDHNDEIDRKELEALVKREVINAAQKMDAAYKKSDTYAGETHDIVVHYEHEINSLSERNVENSRVDNGAIQAALEKISALEDKLLAEKIINEREGSAAEELRMEAEKQATEDTGTSEINPWKISLDIEKSELFRLQTEIERLKSLVGFAAKDAEKRRKVAAGQVDHDIREKICTVTLLREKHRTIRRTLESGEKTCRIREEEFCDARKTVGSLAKRNFVSSSAIEELTKRIKKHQTLIASHRNAIVEITELSIPRLEEDIDHAEEVCSVITEKLAETADTLRKKEKALRDARDVLSRYASTLRRSVARDSDPFRLRDEAMRFLSTSDVRDEAALDADLLQEFDCQIGALKGAYERIKVEPSRSVRDKSTAEFRLSMKNMELLRKVRDLQDEAERLGVLLGEMEAAMTGATDWQSGEQRRRIEFMISAKCQEEELLKLDLHIEEQQREIERFRTMLSAKLAK